MDFNHPKWGRQFEAFADEFSRLCIACKIDILQEGIGERVLNNDETVCGSRNPAAFNTNSVRGLATPQQAGTASGMLVWRSRSA